MTILISFPAVSVMPKGDLLILICGGIQPIGHGRGILIVILQFADKQAPSKILGLILISQLCDPFYKFLGLLLWNEFARLHRIDHQFQFKGGKVPTGEEILVLGASVADDIESAVLQSRNITVYDTVRIPMQAALCKLIRFPANEQGQADQREEVPYGTRSHPAPYPQGYSPPPQ